MEKKKIILIIDDEPDFVKTMQFFLEKSGYKIITALDGKSGIQKADAKPDLILLDLMMPGMSGHEVSKRLKENEMTQAIPIVMLTSQDETIDKVEALDMGVSDYVCKTFPMEEILARIKAALREDLPRSVSAVAKDRDKKLFDLKYALANKRIRVAYQKIADLETSSTIGHEAIVSGPEGTGIEERKSLFNAALEGGLTLDLERLYHGMALRKVKHFRQGNILFLRAETSTIASEYYKSLELLKDSPLEPSQLCLEITERDSIRDMSKMVDALRGLRSKGLKLSICDVNADYQGMKAVEKLRPDYIKIDAALIRCVDIDEVKKSLVRALSTISKNIGAHLIADGLEAGYECGALSSLGVKYGQGPLFGRPSEDI